MAIGNSFSSEQQLTENLATVIADFWQTGHFSHFKGVDQVRINYVYFINAAHSKKIIIVPGRCESYLKYQELSYDLFLQGYNVFIIDHRGQGLSQRLQKNLHKGYVTHFQDYVTDLKYFIEEISVKVDKTTTFILAHSMGAAIATRYLQEKTISINAALLASPMFGFNTGSLPKYFTQKLIQIANFINKKVSEHAWYFFGQKNYHTITFEKNHLTHSKQRYSAFANLYQTTPDLQLGGVTLQWLIEGIEAQKAILDNLEQITTPLLVLQAKEDTVINNQAQHIFCQQLNNIKPQYCTSTEPVIIEGAYHELFFETDTIRNQAINHCLAWFSLHQSR